MPDTRSNDSPPSTPPAVGRVKMEAELQARLESRIRAVLPLLPADIRLERYLNLRLGHHAILIDGADPEKQLVRGRYDLLVLHQERPLLLVELKAPDVPVNGADVDQALSYARLHVPFVPLVLITNGTTSILKQTYNGQDFDATDVAAGRLEAVLKSAAAAAAADAQDAVRTLLGCSNTSWSTILGNWNSDVRAGLAGEIDDFRRPIAQKFVVHREAVSQLEMTLVSGSRVVAVHGPPLSGVTNALAQFSESQSFGPILFVTGDAADVLLHIANRLSRELSFPISKDNVRGWLNTGRGLSQVTIVMDGLPLAIDELVDFANAGLLRLVVGLGTDQFQKQASLGGRMQQTALGRHAVEVAIGPMSDSEFAAASQALDENFGAEFSNGAQYIPSLRWPRTVRVLAATLQKATSPKTANARRMLRPFVGPEILSGCAMAFVPDPSARFDWMKVAKAYLEDLKSNEGEPDWLAATWGRPSVNPDTLEDVLGKTRFEQLRQQGFLSWVDTPIGPRVMIRMEELLAHFVAEEWAGNLAQLRKDERLRTKLDELLGRAALMPLGDVALAAAILERVGCPQLPPTGNVPNTSMP